MNLLSYPEITCRRCAIRNAGLIFGFLLITMLQTTANAAKIRIFAASSLIGVLSKVQNRFENRTRHSLRYTFAASSVLANQISRGAPADIFISANKAWVDFVEQKMLYPSSEKKVFLVNRLVLVSSKKNEIITGKLSRMLITNMLGNSRLSIGDPSHVPAGIYGQQAMENLGLWNTIKNRLAPAGNVRAALAMIERHETPIGIVYRSDALNNNNVHIIYTFPKKTHDTIEYIAIIVSDQNRDYVKEFFNFLTTEMTLETGRTLGFGAP